jgi:hypothetical protein
MTAMRSSLFTIAPFAAMLAATGVVAEPRDTNAGGNGIAMVFAMEQAFESCRGDDVAQTMSCAMRKCEAKATSPDVCKAARWCASSGWSAFMMVRQDSGFSFPVPICGVPSKPALEATMRAHCADQPAGSRCDAVRMLAPDGREVASRFLMVAAGRG